MIMTNISQTGSVTLPRVNVSATVTVMQSRTILHAQHTLHLDEDLTHHDHVITFTMIDRSDRFDSCRP